ncbi:hypothetical protein ACWDRB_30515 [Nonomuraea sp. NPDC003707]
MILAVRPREHDDLRVRADAAEIGNRPDERMDGCGDRCAAEMCAGVLAGLLPGR